MKKVTILGAGISGLAAAWFLKRQGQVEVTVIDKQQRSGGWIRTIEKDGFLFEQGPRSCRSKGSGVATLELIEDLGLQDEVIVADSSAKKRYLWIDQKLQCLPTNFFSLLTSRLMRGVPLALWRDWHTPAGMTDDESIHTFIGRRFGVEIAENFIDPLTTGIYAGDIRLLSIRSCFPKLFEWERQYGSVIRGAFSRKPKQKTSAFVQRMQKYPIFSFKRGMETLIRELARRLESNLVLSTEVTDLNCIEADHVISTLPAAELAKLLPNVPSLLELSSASVAVVNLGYESNILQKRGFGYLIPSKEKEEILGVVWDSSIFPQQNRCLEETRLTVMIGGTHMPKVATMDEQGLTAIALRAVSKHLNINIMPNVISVNVARGAIPQYTVGHHRCVSEVEQRMAPNFTILGNSFYGVSVNDCIVAANRAVRLIP